LNSRIENRELPKRGAIIGLHAIFKSRKKKNGIRYARSRTRKSDCGGHGSAKNNGKKEDDCKDLKKGDHFRFVKDGGKKRPREVGRNWFKGETQKHNF